MQIKTKFDIGDKAFYVDRRTSKEIKCTCCDNTIKRLFIWEPVEFTINYIEACIRDKGGTYITYDSLEKTDDFDGDTVFWADEKKCFDTIEEAQAECDKMNKEEEEKK